MSENATARRVLVTGGAGFIGANFILYWLQKYPNDTVINVDLLTYAGNKQNLVSVEQMSNYHFVHGDICDEQLMTSTMEGVDIVVHFAAESHVDRSIKDPTRFLQTNIMGTDVLLRAALKQKVKRFHHISTDEVFGSLDLTTEEKFTEKTPYSPRSPYAASKASSDHLVRAYGETFGIPYTISNCSNNYGPYQFPEKLLPVAITNILEGKKVPVYGDGQNVRDWLFVEDHCTAIEQMLLHAEAHTTYVVGGLQKDVSNLELVKLVLSLMKQPESMIEFITDRPGHDRKYSVDWSSIHNKLNWSPSVSIEEGLQRTIDWYTNNQQWWKPLKEKNQAYYSEHYGTTTGNK